MDLPLYRHLAALADRTPTALPRPTINLFSGGKHAGGQVPIQDVLIVPPAARTMDDALATVYAVYQAAADLTKRKYGMRALTADEGGLAPDFPSIDAMLADAVSAIEAAGFEPGATSRWPLTSRPATSTTTAAIAWRLDGAGAGCDDRHPRRVARPLPDRQPRRRAGRRRLGALAPLRDRIGGRALVLGDDLLCTNPARIRRALDASAADALLLKVNQIGTLTEAPKPSSWRARPAGASPSAPAAARPRTTGWPTWPSAGAATRSRSARSRSPSGWRNTTACSKSRPKPAYPVAPWPGRS